MPERTSKPKPKREEAQTETEGASEAQTKTDEADDLLDEIDAVLEANAEEFVRSFVQKGGQ